MLHRNIILTLLLLTTTAALGQPMMPDPSKMSGIPRPDGQVPAHTVTVRLIRNAMTNPVVDHPVELIDGSGKIVKTEKTNAEGRATFAELGDGPFNARSVDDSGQELVSQRIEMPPNVGVRVLLLFRASTIGTPDGVARYDKSLAAGTVDIEVRDPKDAPHDGAEVVLVRAEAGTNKMSQEKQTTKGGKAHFTNQPTGTNHGYLLQVTDGANKLSSAPFRLPENLGMKAVFKLGSTQTTGDRTALSLARGTHLLLELGDQAMQAIWVVLLDNGSDTAVELGPTGLQIPLPKEAAGITLGEDAPPGQTVDGHSVIIKGALPPGHTEVRIFFALPYAMSDFSLTLEAPVAMNERAAIIERIDGMKLESAGTEREERELGGKPLWIVRGGGLPPGGHFDLHFSGLPMPDQRARDGAMALAALMLIVGLGTAFAGDDQGADRLKALRALEAERDRLFIEAAELDPGPALKKKLVRLAEIYRRLDETDG